MQGTLAAGGYVRGHSRCVLEEDSTERKQCVGGVLLVLVAVISQAYVQSLMLALWAHCVHRCGAGHTGCWLVCVRALASCPGKGLNGTETMRGGHAVDACGAGVLVCSRAGARVDVVVTGCVAGLLVWVLVLAGSLVRGEVRWWSGSLFALSGLGW